MKKESLAEEFLKAVAGSLSLDDTAITLNTMREDIPEWDSLAHIVLFLELEERFGVKFSTDQIQHLDSLELIFSEIQRCN